MPKQASYTTEDVLYFGRRLREGLCQLQSAQVALGLSLYDYGKQIVEVPLNQFGHSLHPENADWRKNIGAKRQQSVEAIYEQCLGQSLGDYQRTTEDPAFYAQRLRELRAQRTNDEKTLAAYRADR